MEYLMHSFMNIVVAPLAFVALLFFLPHYHSFKRFISIWNRTFCEDVAGKVVLITGASSGIGEQLAYEYARRGACLALVARRETRLVEVAAMAEVLGSPEAIPIAGDVSRLEDCRRFVDITVNHFGQLDHLVANAGLWSAGLFEDAHDVTKLAASMDINFWGAVYSTYCARPHLERSKGKIMVTASNASWLPLPRTSIYNASKAAVVTMYETLRIEMGPKIGITIVNPGFVNSEITAGKVVDADGELEFDENVRKALVGFTPAPLESPEQCAKSMVDAACRGDKCLIEPNWYGSLFLFKVFCPDVIEWSNRLQLLFSRPMILSV